MKLAIVGSRNIKEVNIAAHIPVGVTEIVSGGAKGVDSWAQMFAEENGLCFTVLLPQYERYGRGAPLKRNEQIAAYADAALVVWDGKSRGTAYTIRCFEKLGKPVKVVRVDL